MKRLRAAVQLVMLGTLSLTTADFVVAQEPTPVLLAHLPSSPEENAGRQASAITALTARISEALPEATLEAKIFRRAQDAAEFLETEGERVALVLAEAPFLLDFVSSEILRPAFRALRSGEPNYRRLLVVKEGSGLESLADLEGKNLSYVESAVESDGPFLGGRVFSGHLDPGTWFAELSPVATDFSATAAVLYGQADAALVADDNPLLARHLGKELRKVFESPPLSLPVLSLGPAWPGESGLPALGELESVLQGLSPEIEGGQTLAILGWDGFESLSLASRQALSRLRETRGKALEIAFPSGGVELEAPALPAPAALPFVVAIELPDLPLDPDRILEAGAAGSPEAAGNRR